MTIVCDSIERLDHDLERFDRQVAILIPAFNEAEHIKKLIRRCALVRPAMILVVDDCSTDDTPRALSELIALGLPLRVLTNEKNLGKQGSVRRALQAIVKMRLDAVALIDGDGQHNPAELPALVRLLDDHHLVIGARSQEQMPIHRQLSNALVNIGFLAIGGVDFSDVQSGLRVYRKEAADLLAQKLPSEGGYGLEHESLSILAEHAEELGGTVYAAAAPATCIYGEAKSKMKPEHVIDLAYQTVRHAWRIRKAA
jgi:glycosyltransferase involved in cell wall biosynthesis